MAALQYVDVPGYAAILFRKKFTDLTKPEALMDRAATWLTGTDAKWNHESKMWRFPSGAVLAFGYLEAAKDFRQHQGAAYAFVGFDELTQHERHHYTYLLSRQRRPAGSQIPIRMRAASNPGDTGHTWVYRRFFIEGPQAGRVFIPARLEDNPHLDIADYEKSLAELDPVLRAQLRHGDWHTIDRSNALVPEWTPELARACVGRWPRPTHYLTIEVADCGQRDLTITLHGYIDFVQRILYVLRESVQRAPNTHEFGESAAAIEKELWGGWPNREAYWSSAGAVRPLRYADADFQLSADARNEGLPPFLPVPISNADADRSHCRAMLGQGRIRIDPSCVTLLATLQGGLWNDKRTDYLRTAELGHADAWDALRYMARLADFNTNPFPALNQTWDGRYEVGGRPKKRHGLFGPVRVEPLV
jgi:hypothetical protein